jgi:hypothetical protein
LMRSRLLALMGALALALGGVVVSASPAAADPSHCYGWDTHPNLYNSGGISFLDGTNIRRGPYTDCDVLGLGYPSHGIDVHCYIVNSNDYLWVYLVDTTTGVQGWSRLDSINWVSGAIPRCF